MTDTDALSPRTARRLTWPLRLTRAGMGAEAIIRAFWPLWSVCLVVLAALMLGLQDMAALEVVWGAGVLAILCAGWAAVAGVRAFTWPSRADALARLDATLPGRPLAALADTQAIGSGDAASEAVWAAHLRRMEDKAAAAKAPEPDLTLSSRDPFALRYVALLAFVVALLFGSVWRVASVTEMAPGGGAATLATGPAWEGWVEPPFHTGLPTLYLNDIDRDAFDVAQGSNITIRFYGEIGDLTLSETVSGRTSDVPAATDPTQSFDAVQSGDIAIEGPGGRSWSLTVTPDAPPVVEFDGPVARGSGGRLEAPFVARDDFGVTGGRMVIALDPDAVDRRYGLALTPEAREPVELMLPLPISGDRADFAETLMDDLSQHPYANLPVTMTLFAEDAVGQTGTSETLNAVLPGRRFFDPLAKSIIEQRRDLLWNRDNAVRVAQVLRAVSYQPADLFSSETAYLKLRFALRRLETRASLDAMSDDFVDETAEVLWGIALEIEDGELGDAAERLRRAQDRLAEAIENGATDDEIAELMQELREAMQDYMQQLAEQSQGQQNQHAQNQGDSQEITGDQLQDMLDRLQELMEEGRMAEAQELLEQLRQMMENMQMAEGQQGQGQQGEGEQAMEGLAETLREQQGLSDEAFRDLQEQFNPDAQQGDNQNNTGRSGNQGQGQQHSEGGQEGQGQGSQQGQSGQPQGGGQEQQPGEGGEAGSLADRQQALRDELQRQQQNLPGAGTPEGDAARDALGRAGDAMDEAEESLRNEDFAGALDNQADAMEALREGMRELAEQMAQQQGQPGEQGQQAGQDDPNGSRDPLGREAGQNGRIGTDERLLQGEDVYRRARELLDEIRRRSGEQERPDVELEYLKRLLDRF